MTCCYAGNPHTTTYKRYAFKSLCSIAFLVNDIEFHFHSFRRKHDLLELAHSDVCDGPMKVKSLGSTYSANFY